MRAGLYQFVLRWNGRLLVVNRLAGRLVHLLEQVLHPSWWRRRDILRQRGRIDERF
jgi:hypothetical protein